MYTTDTDVGYTFLAVPRVPKCSLVPRPYFYINPLNVEGILIYIIFCV